MLMPSWLAPGGTSDFGVVMDVNILDDGPAVRSVVGCRIQLLRSLAIFRPTRPRRSPICPCPAEPPPVIEAGEFECDQEKRSPPPQAAETRGSLAPATRTLRIVTSAVDSMKNA